MKPIISLLKPICLLLSSQVLVVDLPAFYLNMNWRTGRPDMWRMEFQQWRMGCSLFEDRNAYALNSPLSHVESIKVPFIVVG